MQRRILAVCLAALVLPCALWAAEPSVEQLLPADAAVAFCYYGDNPDLPKTAVYTLLQEPEVKEWLASLRQTFAGANQLAATFLKVNLASLQPLLGCRMGFAVLPKAGGGGPGGAPPADILVVAKLGGPDAAALRSVTGFLKQIAALAPGGVEQAEVAGMAVTKLGVGPMGLFYGLRGEHLLLGSSQQALEQALKADVPKLASVAGFQRAGKLAGSPVLLLLYNHVAVMERFGALVPPPALAAMRGLGLDEVRAAGFRLGASGRAMVGTAFVQTAGERRGLLRVLASDPVDRALLKLVPRDASVAWVSNLGAGAVYDALVAAAEAVAVAQGVNVREHIAGLEAQIGVNIRGDLFATLGRGTVLTTSGKSLFPALIISQAVKDGERLERALGSLVTHLDAFVKQEVGQEAGARLKAITFGAHTIRYLHTPGVPVPVAPCYTRVGDRVVFALTPIHLKDYLAFLDKGEPSILDLPGYQELAARVPKDAVSISYSDFGDNFVSVYRAFGPLLTMAQGIPRNPVAIDLANMPAASTVRKHLFGSISYAYATDDLIVYECRSPLGVGLIGPAPAVGALFFGGVGAGMMLPALGQARGRARDVASMNNLRQISMATMMYANNHNNELPPSLAALFEGNLLEGDNLLVAPNDPNPALRVGNRPCSYVYLLDEHKGLKLKMADFEHPTQTPLVWERQSFGRRGRNVAFADGHVQVMHDAQFQRPLAQARELLRKKAAAKKGEF